MRSIITRIVVIHLVPCLLADPVMAAPAIRSSFSVPEITARQFGSQALAAQEVFRPMNFLAIRKWISGWVWQKVQTSVTVERVDIRRENILRIASIKTHAWFEKYGIGTPPKWAVAVYSPWVAAIVEIKLRQNPDAWNLRHKPLNLNRPQAFYVSMIGVVSRTLDAVLGVWAGSFAHFTLDLIALGLKPLGVAHPGMAPPGQGSSGGRLDEAPIMHYQKMICKLQDPHEILLHFNENLRTASDEDDWNALAMAQIALNRLHALNEIEAFENPLLAECRSAEAALGLDIRLMPPAPQASSIDEDFLALLHAGVALQLSGMPDQYMALPLATQKALVDSLARTSEDDERVDLMQRYGYTAAQLRGLGSAVLMQFEFIHSAWEMLPETPSTLEGEPTRGEMTQGELRQICLTSDPASLSEWHKLFAHLLNGNIGRRPKDESDALGLLGIESIMPQFADADPELLRAEAVLMRYREVIVARVQNHHRKPDEWLHTAWYGTLAARGKAITILRESSKFMRWGGGISFFAPLIDPILLVCDIALSAANRSRSALSLGGPRVMHSPSATHVERELDKGYAAGMEYAQQHVGEVFHSASRLFERRNADQVVFIPLPRSETHWRNGAERVSAPAGLGDDAYRFCFADGRMDGLVYVLVVYEQGRPVSFWLQSGDQNLKQNYIRLTPETARGFESSSLALQNYITSLMPEDLSKLIIVPDPSTTEKTYFRSLGWDKDILSRLMSSGNPVISHLMNLDPNDPLRLSPDILCMTSEKLRTVDGFVQQSNGLIFHKWTHYQGVDFEEWVLELVAHELSHRRYKKIPRELRNRIASRAIEGHQEFVQALLASDSYKRLKGNDDGLMDELAARMAGRLAAGHKRMPMRAEWDAASGARTVLYDSIGARDLDWMSNALGLLPSELASDEGLDHYLARKDSLNRGMEALKKGRINEETAQSLKEGREFDLGVLDASGRWRTRAELVDEIIALRDHILSETRTPAQGERDQLQSALAILYPGTVPETILMASFIDEESGIVEAAGTIDLLIALGVTKAVAFAEKSLRERTRTKNPSLTAV